MKIMRALCVASFCTGFFVSVVPVSAHHHPPGVDESRIVKVEGTVIGTRWVSPHVVFWVEGNDKAQWLIEAPDRDSLVNEGWRQPALGTTIVFYVQPHVDSSTRYGSGDLPAWYLGAVLSDGTRFGIARDLGQRES
jgi:hypothetical protein